MSVVVFKNDDPQTKFVVRLSHGLLATYTTTDDAAACVARSLEPEISRALYEGASEEIVEFRITVVKR